MNGKSEALDAENAARAGSRAGPPTTPRTADGQVETIRQALYVQGHARSSRGARPCMAPVETLVVTAPPEPRETRDGLMTPEMVLIERCAEVELAGRAPVRATSSSV